MPPSLRVAGFLLLWAAVGLPAPVAAQSLPSIQRVQVLRTPNLVEIEIEGSDRITPQTNLLTGPDRLVVDFVNARPGAQLRNQAVNRDEVKRLRVGLFSSDPPVTRVVLDLNGPQQYQVFPSGRNVIIKIGAIQIGAIQIGGAAGPQTAGFHAASAPALVNASYPAQAEPIVTPPPALPPRPSLEVSFHDGLLSIYSNKASLSEILFAVHQRTGAEIAIPAGAEQEMVVVDLGPAPAPEVLTRLLNGSKFNFLILSSQSNPGALDRVILSSRPDGPMPPPTPQLQPVEDDEAEVQPKVAPPPRPGPPVPATETKPPADNDPPD
jgi:hypothetical protein